MARRNYSAELLKAQENGQKIVCSVEPYAGVEVVYAPRRLRDPRPWTFRENGNSYDGMFRYSGRECRAVHPLTGTYMHHTPNDGYGTPVRVRITHIDSANRTAQIRADHWTKTVQIGTDRLYDADMLNALTDAERFFYDHAGLSYDPNTEIPFIGRVRAARELAKAEAERNTSGMWTMWDRDDTPYADDVHDPDEYGYVAFLYRVNPDTGNTECMNSLGAIDAEPGDPYRRVVEAGLFQSM